MRDWSCLILQIKGQDSEMKMCGLFINSHSLVLMKSVFSLVSQLRWNSLWSAEQDEIEFRFSIDSWHTEEFSFVMGFCFPVSPVSVCFSNYFASEGKDIWLGKIPLDSVFIWFTEQTWDGHPPWAGPYQEWGHTDALGVWLRRLLWPDLKGLDPSRHWGVLLLKIGKGHNWFRLVEKKPVRPCGR